MNSYKFNDKATDSDFLSFNLVKGPAAFHVDDFRKHPLQPHDRLVIVLSTGKKYMGMVVNFDYAIQGNLVEGTLEIKRC